METNGNTPQQGPPWANVPAGEMIRALSAQVAAQAEEMAAMRIYISQLHEALKAATSPADSEVMG
jgi:hypothetical protein